DDDAFHVPLLGGGDLPTKHLRRGGRHWHSEDRSERGGREQETSNLHGILPCSSHCGRPNQRTVHMPMSLELRPDRRKAMGSVHTISSGAACRCGCWIGDIIPRPTHGI